MSETPLKLRTGLILWCGADVTDDFYYIEIRYGDSKRPLGKKIAGKQDIVYQKNQEEEVEEKSEKIEKFWQERKEKAKNCWKSKKGAEPFSDKLEGRTIDEKDDPIDWTL